MAVASFLLFSISVVGDLGGSPERIHNVVPRPNSFFSPTRSIAVLPFVDDSKDASTQYISDGITEGVIDQLSEICASRKPQNH